MRSRLTAALFAATCFSLSVATSAHAQSTPNLTGTWMLDAAKQGRQFDLMVYSPPFASLYTYTATERDMGNSRNEDEFFSHYQFLLPHWLRRRQTIHQQLSLSRLKWAQILALGLGAILVQA